MVAAFWKRWLAPRQPLQLPDAFADVEGRLLDCPFCSGEAGFQLRARKPRRLVVSCRECPAEMDVTYETAEAAADYWNARFQGLKS